MIWLLAQASRGAHRGKQSRQREKGKVPRPTLQGNLRNPSGTGLDSAQTAGCLNWFQGGRRGEVYALMDVPLQTGLRASRRESLCRRTTGETKRGAVSVVGYRDRDGTLGAATPARSRDGQLGIGRRRVRAALRVSFSTNGSLLTNGRVPVTDQGAVPFPGHVFPVERHWVHCLVRAEVPRPGGAMGLFPLRRQHPESQPLLREAHNELPEPRRALHRWRC
jgi:hypothetical protein